MGKRQRSEANDENDGNLAGKRSSSEFGEWLFMQEKGLCGGVGWLGKVEGVHPILVTAMSLVQYFFFLVLVVTTTIKGQEWNKAWDKDKDKVNKTKTIIK